MYTCPECKTTHSASEWNEMTQRNYEGNIIPIENKDEYSSFNCPYCDKEFGYETIRKASEVSLITITISKQEYEELLEFKAMYEGLCK